MKKGLAPIVDQQTEVLILGSGPSDRSIALQQYYGNRGNQFWKVVFGALKQIDPINYTERIALLKANHIGLWDVYGAFDRQGSMDTNYKETQLNDFSEILTLASLKKIIANGNESFRIIEKHALFPELPVEKCSSTSGANNGRQVQRKAEWESALAFLTQ
ncbi:DNA-deoxyinosine glycosylase [Candidatus Enterococcus clewellii]|uniref:DNA-deoxyinosine glycosylase n=1 Tax=Candidatus Enterococcus clewellii TaxID=1834193 RepID=A0A242KF22_9ENTE|nr:DNA-deoxyinosine glycosylase [Enterococcus sp. 9E7_DIV0242]OTP19378.1 DNA-deoxyinosine glycosylase [Enterococcus sp. 9E7_DIV0242]